MQPSAGFKQQTYIEVVFLGLSGGSLILRKRLFLLQPPPHHHGNVSMECSLSG